MISSNSKSLLYVAALALSLSACGEPKDESETEDTEEEAGTVSGTGGGVGGKADSFSVVGLWVGTNCKEAAALALDDGPEYKKQSYDFAADGTLAVSMTMFQDDVCATKAMEMNVTGKYTVGAELSADPAAKELDIEVVTGTLTVHSQEFVDKLNGVSLLEDGEGEGEGDGFCTKATPWIAGQAESFADLECPPDMPKIGGKIYDTVSITGDVMRMTSESKESGKDGSTPETRPTTISTADDEAFKKQ